MAIRVKEALADVPSTDDEEREPQPDPPTPPTDGVEASTSTEEVVNDDSSHMGETLEEGHIVSTTVAKVCGTCHKATTDYSVNKGDWVRCKPCARFKSRMQRAMAADEALREQWNGLSKQARDDWVRDAGQRCEVEGLAKAMHIFIEKSRQTSTEVKSGFKKLYFDSPDLRARYKGKEDQLLAVKGRAPKVFHDVRQTWLYEDYDYCGGVETMESDVATERVQAEQKVKAKAKAKGCGTKKRGHPGEEMGDDLVPLKKLRAKDIRLLDQLKDKTAKARTESDAAVAEDPDNQIPASIRAGLRLMTAELAVMQNDIDMLAKEEHTELNVETTAKKTTALLKEHTIKLKAFRKIQKALQQAQE